MKAKTLLIAAAALAAGVMTSQAQVYSQNVVGYVNVPLNVGYNLIANPLDLDGTGTNNSIYTAVGTALPSTTKVLAYNGSGFVTATLLGSTWSPNSAVFTNAMNPGHGFFIQIPASGHATNVTFVGNVLLGTNAIPIPAGYQVVSAIDPVAGTLDTTNGYNPSSTDKLLVYTSGGYVTHTYLGTSWTSGDPQLTVGQAVFLDAKNNTNYTQILNVQ